jgi:hypothetical protein
MPLKLPQFLTGGAQPRLGKLYTFSPAPELRVHLAPMEFAKQGPLRDACVTYVFGPERDPEYLYMHAAMYDLCLPPLIVPNVLFTSSSCAIVPSPMSIRAPLFKRHVFYDPARKQRYDINGVMFKYLGEFCSLLQVTEAAELRKRITSAREAMLSNHAPSLADNDDVPNFEMEFPGEQYYNHRKMWILARFPNSLEVMDDPEMDLSTIEDAMTSALEKQGAGILDGNDYFAEQIYLWVLANPGVYSQVLKMMRGVLMAIGVKEFMFLVNEESDD